ncbi:MAG: hypothetical protein IT578_09795 [Verrucomicrobiae bacterium]|nr:hypothetical protein [Verrucomicrobiae bacterium]
MRKQAFYYSCILLMLCILGMQECFASRNKKSLEQTLEQESELLKIIQEAPVHKNIRTTVFWVGERARPRSGWSDNLASAWDRRWKESYGGLDSPVYRKGYRPAKFSPKQNPFYVALPFNDISNPDYLEICPLLKYFKIKRNSQTKSVCKNQWIEIKSNDRTCYAQWQDVGPVYTDDYNYVFRGHHPRAHEQEMAGLDVSPAVRDYLGFNGFTRTEWRFVVEEDVPQGPWAKIVTRL